MEYGLSRELLCAAFPFHFVLDSDLSLVDVGPGLQSLNEEMVPGESASRWLTLQRPAVPFEFRSLIEHSGLAYLFECRAVG